jgi:2-(1,2-epoxy-1,2-dihydrophenyl)acetyl-CoA isomerase
MSYQTILFDIASGVARLTLNRPDRLNSFNVQMHDEVRDALTRLASARDARVLVFTGAGRGFCAGQDLGDRAVAPGGQGVDLGHSIETYYKPLVMALRTLPMPVIGAVNGVAAGAGANIALACDLVIAARSASFVQAFCKLGLVPDSGGTWFLPRLVGPARARGLALLADPLSAEMAESWGLIWKCVPDGELIGAANELCMRFAVGPTYGLSLIKRALDASETNDLSTQLDLERDFQRSAGSSPDYKEGVSAFMEKRTPKFTGAKGS